MATENGHEEIIRLLLDKKASTSMKTDKGQTAFDIAMEKNYKKIIRMIHESMVESGASNQLKDCVICFKPRKGTFTFIPCGHAKTCETCCNKIVSGSKTCAICRSRVTQFLKVYD